MEEHLTFRVAPPPGSPGVVIGSLARVVSRDESSATTAIVTQAWEPDANPDRIAVILDVDVFVDREPRDTSAILEKLHEIRNDIFFGSITESTAERFE